MAIQPKRRSVIKQGINFTYHAPTFRDHKVENFYETDTAEHVLQMMKPFIVDGRRFIVMDTEGHALDKKSHDMPRHIVRRWIGTGKKAIPVDMPFCISFCDGNKSISIYDTKENGYAEFKKLAPLLHDASVEKIWHNAKFDMHMLANIGLKIRGKIHDTVVMSKLANENRFSFQLVDLAVNLENGIVKFEYMVDAYKKDHKIADYRMIPRELLSEYANADVWNCYLLFMREWKILVRDELMTLYENELEDMIALWYMERVGMNSDPDYEAPLKADLRVIVDAAEKAVYDAVGYVFNMNSNAQIHKALIHTGVDPSILRQTDKGNPKLDSKEMGRLEAMGIDLVVKIQEYRKAEKLLGTYAVGIYDQRDADHKVHCSVNQTEATTGRMSITKPALQTLPKKNKSIRKIFLPSPGYTLWFMDLDQIEYRLLAHYAQATGLIEAIKKGYDIHAATAALIFNKPIEEITEDERQEAKTVNFSLVYGQGNEATSISLKMNMQQTIRFKENYFAQIPEIQPFINTVHAVVRSRGYVKNWYGRRRRLKSDEAYKAPNALIQGCAADYIKHRMKLIYRFLMAHGYKTRMVNIVHDELIIEVHDSEQFLIPKLRWLLSDFETFRAPITAGAEYGDPSWGNKAEPETDVGFEPLTAEETARMMAYDVHDGSVFDLVLAG